MSTYPSPINNPTMKGYEILATSPEVNGAFRDTTARALVVRYAEPKLNGTPHIVWQEKGKDSDEWRYRPGSNASNCESVIVALMGIK
jgi:hypothetical protein